MRKFIHSNFELDLSVYKITDTGENPWFTNTYFAKYSYPFEIQLTDELDLAMGFLSHYNSSDAQTLFEGWYVHNNSMEKAVLEVEEMENSLSVSLRYGIDDFPNFNKKLAELPLLRSTVPNIYTHAAYVITQGYPNVAYNFPQVHTDKIDPEDNDVWFAFAKIINNYKNGAFLVNDVDLAEEITYNRNIIQPLPYLLYVIKMIIESAGYTLHGDILTDALLQKVLLYTDTEYFTNVSQTSIQVSVLSSEYDNINYDNNPYPRINFARQVDITQPGKYRITGTMRMRLRGNGATASMFIRYRDTVLVNPSIQYWVNPYVDLPVDLVFETLSDLQPDYLVFGFDMGFEENDIAFDLYINPIRLHDDSGEAIPSILNLNQVDLTRAVPDVTCGDLIKFVLAALKMDMTLTGTEMWINYIDSEVANRPVIDLSGFEVKRPNRKFSKGNSFLMKYQDVNSEDYTYAEVFQNKDGVFNTGYTKDDKTTEVTLNGLPLPLMVRNEVQTVHAFMDDASRIFLVLYDGLIGGLNLAKDPAPLLIPNLHALHYKEWFEAQLNSQNFKWSFLAYAEQLAQLTNKSRVHAYALNQLVINLQKTEVSPDLFEVEIETKVFK